MAAVTRVTHRENSQLAYTKVRSVSVNRSPMQFLPVQYGHHHRVRGCSSLAFLLKLQIPPSLECITVHHCSFILGPAGSSLKLRYRRLLRHLASSLDRRSTRKQSRWLTRLASRKDALLLSSSHCPQNARQMHMNGPGLERPRWL